VTIAMVKARLQMPDNEHGALLDGFPRTPIQAEALAKLLSEMGANIKAVPYIMVPSEILVERLGGRWTCRTQGHVYHQKFNPPRTAGKCDVDGSELYQRDDDKAETVANRIRVYSEQTSPLIEHYRKLGLLIEVDGTQAIEKVTADLLCAIQKEAK